MLISSWYQHCYSTQYPTATLQFEGISVLPNYIAECNHFGMELSLSSLCFFVVPLTSWCLCCGWYTYQICVCRNRANSGHAKSHLLYLQWDQFGLLSPLHLQCLFLHLINGHCCESAIRLGIIQSHCVNIVDAACSPAAQETFETVISQGAFNINKWTFRHTLGATIGGSTPLKYAVIGHSVFGPATPGSLLKINLA